MKATQKELPWRTLSSCVFRSIEAEAKRIEQRFPFRCPLKLKEAPHRLHSFVDGSRWFPPVPVRFPPLFECLAWARQQVVEIREIRFPPVPTPVPVKSQGSVSPNAHSWLHPVIYL